jgi:hypothetical protein
MKSGSTLAESRTVLGLTEARGQLHPRDHQLAAGEDRRIGCAE